MTTVNGNGTAYVPQQQNPAQIFAGQPQYQQQPQQVVVEQQQPQQQQVQQPQPQQPQYVNGQMSMSDQNFNLSEAGKELINMIANAQQVQQPQMVQLPNGQVVPVIPQQQQGNNNQGFFDHWYGKGALVGAGGLAGYGLAKMVGSGSGPSGNDVAMLVQSAQTISEANASDVWDAFKSFF